MRQGLKRLIHLRAQGLKHLANTPQWGIWHSLLFLKISRPWWLYSKQGWRSRWSGRIGQREKDEGIIDLLRVADADVAVNYDRHRAN